jgi:hypothetical protein
MGWRLLGVCLHYALRKAHQITVIRIAILKSDRYRTRQPKMSGMKTQQKKLRGELKRKKVWRPGRLPRRLIRRANYEDPSTASATAVQGRQA